MYFEQIRTLLALADGGEPVVAGLARVMLAMLEALRDAETRADLAEARHDAGRDTLTEIGAILARSTEADTTDALRRIAGLLDQPSPRFAVGGGSEP